MDSVKYLTYEDYTRLGGTLDEASFNLYEFKCRKQLDYYTYNRLIDGVPSDIKNDIDMVMMSLININTSYDEQNGKMSESIDGYSVSYGGTQETSIKVKNTISQMLSGLEVNGVPITYCGGVNDNKRNYYFIPQD